MIELLSNNGYIVVNKSLIKKLGLNQAILLGELCSEYSYYKRENKLENGMFYSTRENIENNTGLSSFQQRSAIKTLENLNIIETFEKGMPQRTWYKISKEVLYQLVMNDEKLDLTTCSE